MDNRLFQALREPKDPPKEPDVAEKHTDRAHPVKALMESLRDQAVAALSGNFFDAGIDAEIMPERTVVRSRARTLRLRARRREPPYEVQLELEVRCDSEDPGSGGAYTVRGAGAVRCQRTAATQSDFSVTPTIREDGTLHLDGDDLRDRIAAGIRHLGDITRGE